jgi:uncharacterized membrane protein
MGRWKKPLVALVIGIGLVPLSMMTGNWGPCGPTNIFVYVPLFFGLALIPLSLVWLIVVAIQAGLSRKKHAVDPIPEA